MSTDQEDQPTFSSFTKSTEPLTHKTFKQCIEEMINKPLEIQPQVIIGNKEYCDKVKAALNAATPSQSSKPLEDPIILTSGTSGGWYTDSDGLLQPFVNNQPVTAAPPVHKPKRPRKPLPEFSSMEELYARSPRKRETSHGGQATTGVTAEYPAKQAADMLKSLDELFGGPLLVKQLYGK